MKIAVIPARGGSKRIPKKNIKSFCGKPMIAWPIQTAKKSRLFDHILVSTDDEEIAEVAKNFGAEIHFIRPSKLADDHVGIIDVVYHAVDWMLENNWSIDAVCCILSTASLLQVEDLKRGWKNLNSGSWLYTFSVTEYNSTVFRSFIEHKNGGLEMLFPECWNKRSQDLPVAMYDAAQFYWGRPEAWLKKLKIFEQHSCPVKIPHWRVQDIDNPDDWLRAEILFELISKKYNI